MTGPEFAAKCDWEGGLLDAMFGYGLRYPDSLDVQTVQSLPSEVHIAFAALEAVRQHVDVVARWVDEQLTIWVTTGMDEEDGE